MPFGSQEDSVAGVLPNLDSILPIEGMGHVAFAKVVPYVSHSCTPHIPVPPYPFDCTFVGTNSYTKFYVFSIIWLKKAQKELSNDILVDHGTLSSYRHYHRDCRTERF
jgi:hypothetical protein